MALGLLAASATPLAANPINCADDAVAPCDGATGDDEMTGASLTDYTCAKEGNDILRGLGKFDDLRGGSGNDNLDAGGGSDKYDFYEDNWGADRISGDRSGAQGWLIFHGSQTAGGMMIDLVPSPDRPDEVPSGTNRINFASRPSLLPLFT